jgi:membrane carboxypeptidase/penicillin-binding protein
MMMIMGKRKILSARLTAGLVTLIIGSLLAIGCLYWFLLKDLPSPTKLTSSSLPQSTQIFDRNGTLLYTIYAMKNPIALANP